MTYGGYSAAPIAAGGGDAPTSGVYVPTFTSVAPAAPQGVTVTAPEGLHWSRIGDVVTVAGRLHVLPTILSPDTAFDMTLPFASSDLDGLGGVANGSSAPQGTNNVTIAPGIVTAASGNARVSLSLQFNDSPGAFSMGVTFTYTVVA